MMNTHLITLCSLLAASLASQATTVACFKNAVNIDGKNRDLIIETDKNGKATKFLTRKLQEITGKNNTPKNDSSKAFTIHVGQTDYAKSLNLNLQKLHPFGYVMVCRDGQNLVLAGRNEETHEYAVNDFLKRFAGYRKFGTQDILEVTPKHPTITLPKTLECREEPDVNSYILPWTHNQAFGRNCRLNSMATHALVHVVPPEKFSKTHPEYYPMINGKRKKVVPHQYWPWNPCLANPDLPRLVAEYADRYFKENPDKISLPMGVNDGGGDCQCPYCRELLRRSGNQYAEFYNMAARVLAKTHPGKFLAFIAYSKTASKPPKGITMEPNILVETIGFTSHGKDKMKQWKDLGVKNFGLYDYIYTTGGQRIVPQFFPHRLGNAWKKLYKTYHLKSLWMEYFPTTEIFDAPRQYVLDELAWNMDADIDALLDDYCTSMFQQAAPELRAFFNLLETCFMRTIDPQLEDGYFGVRHDRKAFTRDDLKNLKAYLHKAQERKLPDIVHQRLNAMSKLFQVISLHAINAICTEELRNAGPIQSLQDCQRRIDIAGEAYEAQDKLAQFTLTPEEEKQLFTKKNLATFASTALAPAPILEAVLDPALQNIADYLKKQNLSVVDFFNQAAQKATLTPHKAILKTQVFLQQHELQNLVVNHDFESTEDNTVKPQISDHIPMPKANGWVTWTFPNSVTKFELTTQEKHSGTRAAVIRENQAAGAFISYVTLKPNCRYRLSAWIKRNCGNVAFKGCGYALLRMMKNGKWIDGGSAIKADFTPDCENKWVRYETTFTAPNIPDVSAIIIISSPQQTPDTWTAVDDVALEIIYDPER